MYLILLVPLLLCLFDINSATVLPSPIGHTLIGKRQTSDSSCVSGVHIIAVPGYGDGAGNYGYIGSLVNAIQSQIPNSNSWLAGPYDTSGSFVDGTAGVEAEIRQHLADYYAACPTTYIAIVGISAGGVTTMNTICGSVSPPWPATTGAVSSYPIIAAIAYGDPTFAAGQPFNTGDCPNNAPNGYRTDYSSCSNFLGSIQNYCNAADPVCCSGGTDSNAHVTYDAQFDPQAAAFVAAQYNSHVGAKKT